MYGGVTGPECGKIIGSVDNCVIALAYSQILADLANCNVKQWWYVQYYNIIKIVCVLFLPGK